MQNAKDSVIHAKDVVVNKVDELTDSGKLKDAKDAIVNAKDSTVHAVERVRDKSVEKYEEIKNSDTVKVISEKASDAKDKVADMYEHAPETWNNTKSTIVNLAHDTKDKVEEINESPIVHTIKDTLAMAGEKLSEAYDAVKMSVAEWVYNTKDFETAPTDSTRAPAPVDDHREARAPENTDYERRAEAPQYDMPKDTIFARQEDTPIENTVEQDLTAQTTPIETTEISLDRVNSGEQERFDQHKHFDA